MHPLAAAIMAASGKGAGTVDLGAPTSISDYTDDASTAAITISVNRAGTITFSGNGTVTETFPDYAWISPPYATVGDLYQVQLAQNSGTTVTGSSLSTWLALTSNRTWTVTRLDSAGIGTNTANVTLSIRRGTGSTLDSVTFNMVAQVDLFVP